MCIIKTVGIGGSNTVADVRSIQLLLNMNSGQRELNSPLVTDGLWGAASRIALEKFRQGAGIAADKPVAPGDATIKALRAGLPNDWVAQKLWLIMIDAGSEKIARFHQPIIDALAHYKINTPLRIAHFLAQIAHESGCLRYTEELASGKAYDGRADLGNDKPNDGPLFKGRGLIQLTGRSNYRQYGRACGHDFENKDDPRLVGSDPGLAVDVAGWFWSGRGLNALADLDQLDAITRKINGGTNGLNDRAAFLARAKWLLIN
jgi:putative chitinase